MQIKGTIRFFAILFILVSVYSLSFTYCTRRVEKNAKDFAYNEQTQQEAKMLANGDTLRERMLYDSLAVAKESRFLDSMSNEVVYNLLVKKYTYKDCKEKELNLGLDLKGGMNVTLEISESEIIRALSGNNKDAAFNKAINMAIEKQRSSQTAFLDLFVESIRELEPNKPLAAYFLTRDMNDKIKTTSTDDEVIGVLNEEINSAIDRTFMVLRKRIDKFGVTQPNIQKLSTQGRILVELPGVKDPTRVRKILQGTAKLEFLETWEFAQVYPILEKADARIKSIKDKSGLIDTDTIAKDSVAAADTAQVKPNDQQASTLEQQLNNVPAATDSAQINNAAQAAVNNPLLALFTGGLNIVSDEGQSYYGQGPLIGLVQTKDTALMNSYLKQTADMFPNTRFLWGATPAKSERPGSFVELIAIRLTTSDGKAKLEGDKVADAWQDYDQNGRVEVSMMMTSEGTKIWKKMTGDNVGKCIAIVLDNYVYSYPTVNGEIPSGRSSITGTFGVAEAQDLANVLKSGKLPAPARIVEEAIVGPSLGAEAIHSGLMSFIIAFILVLLYMIFFYNKAGLAANIALISNVLFIFGALSSLGAVLTLPGIAGIVLTLGMAVDANVIIYERIKEELRAGKGVRLAIDDGYKNAYSAIIDGNVTTLLTGIVLAWFGTGPVQGFATTLIIGILTSLFSAIFISRLFFIWLLDRNKNITFENKFSKGFLVNTKLDFIKARKVAYFISGAIIAIGIYFLAVKGLNYGVDFSGGRTYVVRFDKDVSANEVRSSLFAEMKETPEVKTFGGANQLKITTKYLIDDNSEQADSLVEVKIYEALKGFFGTTMTFEEFTSDNPDKVLGRLSSQKVGPTIADDIKQAAVYSIIVALIIIFIYIAIRFKKWYYGLGGVLALFHDSLITISLFSIFYGILPFNLEVDQAFIAAILTIIGYSINDTVIIFDRIREYNTLFPKRSARENMNGAINSTLARTVNTAGSTIVVLLAIFLLGGEIIRGFSFALLVGVVVGTYSSVFVATPLAYELMSKKKKQ
ncbi:MAG: protein translocase subunit SecDF [Bacteroidetes bacterium HGW-Bacteroidetes-6]|jgi:SecD/SecF fusion protein|nr:MAG: protein translocase subunit SecDF [Bacteroidetes bacterium HGW-Bacteroidetes-6]